MARDLETLDNALKLVAPDLDIPAIAQKLGKQPEDWRKRGEMSRVVFAILRVSGYALTSREIAAGMIVQRGLAATPQFVNPMIRHVAGCLRDKREQGLVEIVPTRGGLYLEWCLKSQVRLCPPPAHSGRVVHRLHDLGHVLPYDVRGDKCSTRMKSPGCSSPSPTGRICFWRAPEQELADEVPLIFTIKKHGSGPAWMRNCPDGAWTANAGSTLLLNEADLKTTATNWQIEPNGGGWEMTTPVKITLPAGTRATIVDGANKL